jgi:hypothetical protein
MVFGDFPKFSSWSKIFPRCSEIFTEIFQSFPSNQRKFLKSWIFQEFPNDFLKTFTENWTFSEISMIFLKFFISFVSKILDSTIKVSQFQTEITSSLKNYPIFHEKHQLSFETSKALLKILEFPSQIFQFSFNPSFTPPENSLSLINFPLFSRVSLNSPSQLDL